MSEQDQSNRPQTKSDADQTLLGVAPPRIDSAVDPSQRAPVYVRSGTSVADIDPVSRAVLPSSPLRVAAGAAEGSSALPSAGAGAGFGESALGLARQRPVLWMALTPVLFAGLAILIARHAPSGRPVAAPISSAEHAPSSSSAVAPVEPEHAASVSIAELEAKPAASLTAHELVLLADARSARQQAAASALRHKVEADPALAKDSAVTSELSRLAADDRTARDALAGMAALEAPLGADLLYETWTATAQRSDTTELSRALLYSPDVRPKASPALAVALGLRVAETCEQYQAILPNALKDGDRRSLHLLTKLNAKHGCGPKKAADCYACLREHSDELTATINAVKSRRPPSYAAQ